MAAKGTLLHRRMDWNLGNRFGLTYVQKYVYPYVSRRFGSNDVLFINYGYEERPPMAVPLDAADERNRYCIQLYHRAAEPAELAGKRVLEVGCGHGGGSSYLVRTFRPASYVGLDLNPDGIEFCRKRHRHDRLSFVQGDAEQLPFPDESFDVVVNIESSIHYPHFPRFLDEVARVLSPGGHLVYADGRKGAAAISSWDADLAASPLTMRSEREINPEVLRALDCDPLEGALQGVYRRIPKALRPMAQMWSSWVFKGLRSGKVSYRMYTFTKA